MRRSQPAPRLLAAGVAALAALSSIAACGDDDGGDRLASGPSATAAGTSAPTATEPTVTVPLATTPNAAYDHPTSADEAVIAIGFEGGFMPAGSDFVNAPTLLVAGDGTAVVTGPQIAIYPGPLLPNLQQARIEEPRLQQLLAQADELGLLADVEYARNDMVADAPDTVVRITAAGQTFEHRAYALGLDGTEADEDRANLQQFVEAATALADDVTAEASTAYESDSFLVQARPTTVAELGSDVEPTVVPWPDDASVRLADAAKCAEIPWEEGQPLFAEATQITLFEDGTTTYQLSAVPRLPGRSC